jgi:hypothetical protein
MLDGTTSQKLKETVLEARLPDGTKFGDSPDVMRLLVSLALVQNPAGIVVPGGSADPLQGAEDEITKIEKVMRENRPAYDKDVKMQTRLRDLYGAREKLKDRSRA